MTRKRPACKLVSLQPPIVLPQFNSLRGLRTLFQAISELFLLEGSIFNHGQDLLHRGWLSCKNAVMHLPVATLFTFAYRRLSEHYCILTSRQRIIYKGKPHLTGINKLFLDFLLFARASLNCEPDAYRIRLGAITVTVPMELRSVNTASTPRSRGG